MSDTGSVLEPGDPDAGQLRQPTEPFLTVRYRGQDIPVPREDAVRLVSQGMDYTQKTQELAEQRRNLRVYEQLEDQLRTDPGGTIRRLAQVYGVADQVQPPTTRQQESHVDDPWNEPSETESALEARLRALEGKLQAQDRQALEARYSDQLEQARAILGDDFDERALMEVATQEGIGNLAAAAAMVDFWERQEAAESNGAVLQAKRELPPVESGMGPGLGSLQTSADSLPVPRTIREAFEQAEALEGVNFTA